MDIPKQGLDLIGLQREGNEPNRHFGACLSVVRLSLRSVSRERTVRLKKHYFAMQGEISVIGKICIT